MQFNSFRMRMSVLVRAPDGQVLLFSKGADATMLELVAAPDSPSKAATLAAVETHLDEFSRKGLRTLVVGMRVLEPDTVEETLRRLHQASAALENRSAALESVYASLERDLTLLGATAVEDKLQPGVKNAMDKFREAGICLWVLTGDKVETAINISLSSGHFTHQTNQLAAVGLPDEPTCLQVLQSHRTRLLRARGDGVAGSGYGTGIYEDWQVVDGEGGCVGSVDTTAATVGTPGGTEDIADNATHLTHNDGHVLVIDGKTLAIALETCKPLFKEVAWWVTHKHPSACPLPGTFSRKPLTPPLLLPHCACSLCDSVLCCRLSPLQKALVVRLIKAGDGKGLRRRLGPITLAIGDGANDVAMIQEAHIGVGILGKEGRQAARSSDFSFGRFEILLRLILVHGHQFYDRISFSVHYFFYKALVFVVPLFMFEIFNSFSSQVGLGTRGSDVGPDVGPERGVVLHEAKVSAPTLTDGPACCAISRYLRTGFSRSTASSSRSCPSWPTAA